LKTVWTRKGEEEKLCRVQEIFARERDWGLTVGGKVLLGLSRVTKKIGDSLLTLFMTPTKVQKTKIL